MKASFFVQYSDFFFRFCCFHSVCCAQIENAHESRWMEAHLVIDKWVIDSSSIFQRAGRCQQMCGTELSPYWKCKSLYLQYILFEISVISWNNRPLKFVTNLTRTRGDISGSRMEYVEHVIQCNSVILDNNRARWHRGRRFIRLWYTGSTC